ncbi:unnamed protein product [Aureobasidium vineae]|uniref:Uncharacterized protein n=1 Tax=Aureobasidium vineae TaxID=2773715 RepID=A0A9N8JQS6_9PEZI|nr:unnamed protein product [Aureobasidium vineae]
MQALRILSLVVFFTFVLGIYSSPVLHERAISKCTPKDIAIVRRTVKDEAYFCKWWLSETKSPFLEFSPLQVTDLCRCISPAKTTTKKKRAELIEEATVEARLERRQTMTTCRAKLSIQFSQPWRFCVFYTSYPRTTSPFARYSAKGLTKLCGCVNGNVVSTSSKKTLTFTKSASRTVNPFSKASSSSKKHLGQVSHEGLVLVEAFEQLDQAYLPNFLLVKQTYKQLFKTCVQNFILEQGRHRVDSQQVFKRYSLDVDIGIV